MESANLRLNDSITQIKQVSEVRAKALNQLGVFTVRDLLHHFPRRYLDLSKIIKINLAKPGNTYTIVSTIYNIEEKEPKPGMQLLEITLVDETSTLIVTMFRQPWLKQTLKKDYKVAVSGKLEFKFGFKRMTNPYIEVLSDNSNINEIARIISIYDANSKISSAWIRRIIQNAIDYVQGLEGYLPKELDQKYKLLSLNEALSKIHSPKNTRDIYLAKRTLKYNEVFLLQAKILKDYKKSKSIQHKIDGECLKNLIDSIPYKLRNDQEICLSEISMRMASDEKCNHLIFGDVGSGKTILAACATAIAVDSGHTAIMMAPTEVLVEQHKVFFEKYFKVETLTSSTKDKNNVIELLNSGKIDLLIGTHAVLNIKVENASLVIIDEQHRFGVEQREKLSNFCDVLYLSATPIPRTLALALYGDMTFSYLKPITNKKRITKVIDRGHIDKAHDKAFDELEKGRQVFIVCPLIESEENLHAAKQHSSMLQNTIFTNYNVGLLHGRLSSDEKKQVIFDFKNKKIDILVCTSIIEVGIDIPNANVMIIEDADRFGLSQLHQLRGRVGRDGTDSYVFLVSNLSNNERLEAMEKIDDGTKLSRIDLSQRQEGNLLGNRQHGKSILRLIDIDKDMALIKTANKDAKVLVQNDPELKNYRMLSYELSCVFKGTSNTVRN